MPTPIHPPLDPPGPSGASAAASRESRRARLKPPGVPIAVLLALLLFTAVSFLETRTMLLVKETARTSVELAMRITDVRLAENLFAPYPEPRLFTVTVTAYSPTPDQTWGDPWIGAMGRRVRPGKTLAVSHDLRHLLGSRVYVQDVGYLVAEDLMHPRWENRVDLCLGTRERAKAFGIRQLNMVVLD